MTQNATGPLLPLRLRSSPVLFRLSPELVAGGYYLLKRRIWTTVRKFVVWRDRWSLRDWSRLLNALQAVPSGRAGKPYT
jgi:hypothetical protein